MARDTPAGHGLTGAEVVFTPGRGYRVPVARRGPVVTSAQPDPEFADKARLIGQWWHDHGQGAVPG